MKVDLIIGEQYVMKKGSTYAYWSDPAPSPTRYFYYSNMWDHAIVQIENVEMFDENFFKVYFINVSDSSSRVSETVFYDDTKITIPDKLRFIEAGSKEQKELFLKISKLRDIFVPNSNKLTLYFNRIRKAEAENAIMISRFRKNFNIMLDDQYYKSLRRNDYENVMTSFVKEMENETESNKG